MSLDRMQPIVAGLIFAVSLVLLLVRPRRVPDWAVGAGGGLAMLACGVLPIGDGLAQLVAAWNVFLFFLGLTISAAVAEHAGLFRQAAALAARTACGSQQRLLVGLYLGGALITAVLSNDATALLLTPVAFGVARRLGLEPRPYVFACVLVANAASFVLPVANPANLLILSAAPLPLGTFFMMLALPSLLALGATLAGLLVVFRAELAAPFVEPPAAGSTWDRRVAINLAGVGGLMLAYVVGSAAGWPLGVVAIVGAAGLVGLDIWAAGWAGAHWWNGVPWGLFPLLAGLLLLVGGAERAGLFGPLVGAIDALQAVGEAGLPVGVMGMAVVANLINNLPAALVAATTLHGLTDGPARVDLVAAVLIGVDLGPNLTPVGALSTLLWLLLLRRRGLHVTAWAYMRVAVQITLPALLAAAGGLWLVVHLVGRA